MRNWHNTIILGNWCHIRKKLWQSAVVSNDNCSFFLQLDSHWVIAWTIVFYNMYINLNSCRFLFQKARSLFWDARFSIFFCSTEPSYSLCDGSISKSPSGGFLWMVSSDSPLPTYGLQGLPKCIFKSPIHYLWHYE